MQKDLKGYNFTKEAILMLLGDMHLRNEITKGVYPAIAQKFDTTPQRVASAIRKVIGNSWNIKRDNFVHTIYGKKASHRIERPTNLEFITTIAERLHLNME
ncbi:Stage 0 sporulation protein A [bioreactor metagenome]|uniref:Stage 0 sporulation protein A n=1 Tax=bioreactor metagenome TaxID=1076179 RepID=A0A645DR58_9ZZZZ